MVEAISIYDDAFEQMENDQDYETKFFSKVERHL